ncbi:MAG: nucleotide exchange factor GrpE [Gemmataceae bacterium]
MNEPTHDPTVDRVDKADPTPDSSQAEAAPAPSPNADELARLVDTLRVQLASAEKTRDEYLELARAGRREFESYQQRARREAEAERRYAQMPLAKDLLPVLDNLERAIAAAKQSNENSSLAQGVAMVVGMLQETLRRHGIVRIEAENQPFDANLHEAVMQQPNTEVPANTVLQVLESGYLMHERVLRPARVIVSTT